MDEAAKLINSVAAAEEDEALDEMRRAIIANGTYGEMSKMGLIAQIRWLALLAQAQAETFELLPEPGPTEVSSHSIPMEADDHADLD